MKYTEIEGIDGSTYAGKAAKACKIKARGILGEELLIFHLVDFISFMILNNKFCSKGIFITEDNREECYIKIIEMNDESLIEDLEKYIKLRDNIQTIENKKEQYVKIIEKLKALNDYNDEKCVNEIIEQYLRM